ncbi:hypothetical protein, partial [Prevotella sp. P5-126]|uniref:hypothetical protein n=1 Tax=Prevotella sp. P5-126 TaxID=2024216 RepID=UPI001C1F81E8
MQKSISPVLCTFPQSFPLKTEFRNSGIGAFRVLFSAIGNEEKDLCASTRPLYIINKEFPFCGLTEINLCKKVSCNLHFFSRKSLVVQK